MARPVMKGRVRKICYVTGTRADFGLMQKTLHAIDVHPGLSLEIVATGMHLSRRFGSTITEIEDSGLTLAAKIPVDIDVSTGAAMAHNLATTLHGAVDAFQRIEPDIVLLLGDRGEMMAGALAAIHLNIPLAHIHGGERSGTVDEPVRHAISKLSHFHFVSSEGARRRLIRMGEHEEYIFVTGAPGLDGLQDMVSEERVGLCAGVDFESQGKVALLVYHPVLQEADFAPEQTRILLESCLSKDIQVMALMPNSDAGAEGVRRVLEEYAEHPHIRVRTHLPRREFISWMAACDLMLGNSSSGIIEAATFGTPVVNVGNRQQGRERSANVFDAIVRREDIEQAINEALRFRRRRTKNVYGDGQAGERIANLLESLSLDENLLMKCNAY